MRCSRGFRNVTKPCHCDAELMPRSLLRGSIQLKHRHPSHFMLLTDVYRKFFFFIISFLSLSCSVKRIWWPCPTPTYLSSARLKCSFEPQWPENLCKPSSCSNFSWRLHSVTPFMTLCIWYWDHCFVTWLCEKQVSLSQRWLQLHPLFNHGWVFILWTSVSFVLLRTRHL